MIDLMADKPKRKRLRVLERPRTRGDCVNGIRPCPWVSCSQHLYLDVGPSGAIKTRHVDAMGEPLEVGQLAATCALDVATEARSQDMIARLLGFNITTIVVTERAALAKLKAEYGEGDGEL